MHIDQLAEALRFLADQQTKLGTMLIQKQVLLGEKSRKDWADITSFRNVSVFGGESKGWEEFAEKLKSQVAATDVQEAKVLDEVESKIGEAELETDSYIEILADEDFDKDGVFQLSSKMHNLLLNLTTGEANAIVRRCRGRHGLLAWKKLCTSLNPRTLASGVKAISQAMNPPKIGD